MAEYRALRERHSLLEICANPDLATEVTLQPVRRIDVDAAILFSDLLLPLEPMGLPFDFIKGEGPQLERPIDTTADIDRLKVFEPREALRHVLPPSVRSSRARRSRPAHRLCRCAVHAGVLCDRRRTLEHVRQDQGADVRPSGRAGIASARSCRRSSRTISSRRSTRAWTPCRSSTRGSARSAPRTIASSRCPTPAGSSRPSDARADDSLRDRHGRDPRGAARRRRRRDRRGLAHSDRRGVDAHRRRPRRAGQPRSDAAARSAGADAPADRQRARRVGNRPGHIFNLGHGILPSTPVEHVQMLAQYVHSASRRP